MISKTDIQTVLDALETAASYHIGYSKRREAAIAILTAALARVDKPLEPSEAIEPNNDEVICPNCCTQFRAIPVNVQKLLMEAGIEPPFTHPAIKLDDDRIADLENSFEIERLKAEKAFYKNRVELLHKWQSKMRDPERTLVCDILANGQIWHDESRYTPQTSKPEPSEPFSKVLQSATNYDGTWSALVTAPCWLPTGLPLFTHPASSNHLDEISKVLHYPDCWDTAAYPTLEDAIIEAKSWAHCTNEDCQCPTKDA